MLQMEKAGDAVVVKLRQCVDKLQQQRHRQPIQQQTESLAAGASTIRTHVHTQPGAHTVTQRQKQNRLLR